MKLYSAASPRRNDFYRNCPTPASAYTRQQHLLAAYREVLYTWWAPEDLILSCFGHRTGKRLQAAEDRLDYDIPDLLERMTPAELEQAADAFCANTLPGFVHYVLNQERTLQHRLDGGNCSTRLDDDSHAKAAGLGKGKPARVAIKPTVQRQLPARPRPVRVPVLRVAHSPKYWSQVRQQSQLSLWPPVEAFGAGVAGGAL